MCVDLPFLPLESLSAFLRYISKIFSLRLFNMSYCAWCFGSFFFFLSVFVFVLGNDVCALCFVFFLCTLRPRLFLSSFAHCISASYKFVSRVLLIVNFFCVTDVRWSSAVLVRFSGFSVSLWVCVWSNAFFSLSCCMSASFCSFQTLVAVAKFLHLTRCSIGIC